MVKADSVLRTDLPLPGRVEGKVRDTYDAPLVEPIGGQRRGILLVATDRISAFDVVLPCAIPGKGRLLTDISLRWFRWIERQGICPTHVIDDRPEVIAGLDEADRELIRGRCVIGRRLEIVPVECVVRGYIEGSGWRDYVETGRVCGHELPPGLRQADRLPEPLFTPATKARRGEHDENITFESACELVGGGVMERLRRTSLQIYRRAHEYARERGIILADTKFEFGLDPQSGDPVLADEALTPDSSRFWPADAWSPGREQQSFDKQFVREHLQRLVDAGSWDKRAPGPVLPDDVVDGTRRRYEAARDQLFG